jgi:hypothetical protein
MYKHEKRNRSHNDQHIQDKEKWLRKIENMGLKEAAHELK